MLWCFKRMNNVMLKAWQGIVKTNTSDTRKHHQQNQLKFPSKMKQQKKVWETRVGSPTTFSFRQRLPPKTCSSFTCLSHFGLLFSRQGLQDIINKDNLQGSYTSYTLYLQLQYSSRREKNNQWYRKHTLSSTRLSKKFHLRKQLILHKSVVQVLKFLLVSGTLEVDSLAKLQQNLEPFTSQGTSAPNNGSRSLQCHSLGDITQCSCGFWFQ